MDVCITNPSWSVRSSGNRHGADPAHRVNVTAGNAAEVVVAGGLLTGVAGRAPVRHEEQDDDHSGDRDSRRQNVDGAHRSDPTSSGTPSASVSVSTAYAGTDAGSTCTCGTRRCSQRGNHQLASP